MPGYSATILVVIFFGALNLLGLGVIGTYSWRAYENSKSRPLAICMEKYDFIGEVFVNKIIKIEEKSSG